MFLEVMLKERLKYFLEIFLKKNKQDFFIIFCTVLFIFGIFAEDAFIRQKPRVIFCDVGQGDGIMINFDGTQILVDGGPDNKFTGCIGKYMPMFDRTIEYIIISHPDKDHFVGAIEILKRYDVKKIFINGDVSGIAEYKEFLRLAGNKIKIATSQSDFETNGAKIDFINLGGYKDTNANSLVFNFKYKGKNILFTGDASIETEKDLIESGANLSADILKAGHHGSKTSTSKEFLSVVKPEIVIISVGENRYGHPSYRVIKNLEQAGIKYLRTDKAGDIVIKLDK